MPNQNQSRLGRTCFPALGAVTLRVFASSSHWFVLLTFIVNGHCNLLSLVRGNQLDKTQLARNDLCPELSCFVSFLQSSLLRSSETDEFSAFSFRAPGLLDEANLRELGWSRSEHALGPFLLRLRMLKSRASMCYFLPLQERSHT